LIHVIITSSIRSNRRFLDQCRSSKLCTRGRPCLVVRQCLARAGLGRPCLVVGQCLARVVRWFLFSPKCVPVHKNCNTTHGTLLVSKMCMKLVVYPSRTRGFDSQIFVVRTVKQLPQAKCLLILEQSLDLASVDQELHGVITQQVPRTNSMLFLQI
jgi:hypothetical protein